MSQERKSVCTNKAPGEVGCLKPLSSGEMINVLCMDLVYCRYSLQLPHPTNRTPSSDALSENWFPQCQRMIIFHARTKPGCQKLPEVNFLLELLSCGFAERLQVATTTTEDSEETINEGRNGSRRAQLGCIRFPETSFRCHSDAVQVPFGRHQS